MSNNIKLIDSISNFNPWWINPSYRPPEAALSQRDVFPRLISDITRLKQIIALVGLRRVGKSTLMKQSISQLLSAHSPSDILYFSFDEPDIAKNTTLLEDVIRYYLDRVKKQAIYHLDSQCYLFLDEVQQVPYWQNVLKRYYDLNSYLKFVVSGSSSLFIRQASHESLAGRMFEIFLAPLGYQEYRRFFPAGEFADYLNFGGFPELLVLPAEKRAEYLKDWILRQIIEVDVPKLTRLRKTADFAHLFWTILTHYGQIIRFSNLQADLGIKKPTLYLYVDYLKQSLVINEVMNQSGSFRSTTRLIRKLYPASPNFLALTQPPAPIGFQVEAYVAQALLAKFKKNGLYYSKGKEIDFWLPEQKLAIEVKYQNILHPEDYKFLLKTSRLKGFKPVLITKNQQASPDESITCISAENLETWLKAIILP